MKYKTIDLCAGIGGIRKGFELTGSFENVLSAEVDPFAAATYKHLYHEDPTNDITSDEFKQVVDSVEYDVLLAGFPCQTFSRIGKQLGFRDTTRGTLFFDIADIISRTKPRAVFLENVENLVSHDGGNTIETIIKTLEDELEYRVIGVTLDEGGNYKYNRSSFIRNTKDFGLPQNRPRAYIMAFSKEKYGKAIKLLNQQLPTGNEHTIYKDIFAILDTNVDDKYYMAQGYLDTLKRHKERNNKKGNGFGYCVVNQKKEAHPIAYTILATGGSGKERNLIYQPKDDIAGKMIGTRKTGLNSEGIRIMTPNEWGRLQGFVGYAFVDKDGNDSFSFPGGTTDGQKFKQLGNSVSIPVIETMADFMLGCFKILEEHQVEEIRALAENNEFFTKQDVMELLNMNAVEAGELLKSMIDARELLCITRGVNTRYFKKKTDIRIKPITQVEKVIKFAEAKNVITNQDIQKLLGINADCVNVLLSGMRKKGLIIRLKKGQYSKVNMS